MTLASALDYHKLRYFWHAARAGSLAGAARTLQVAQPTVSTQVQALEERIGANLFDRRGGRLTLTDLGRTTFRYADQIFELGSELERSLASGTGETPRELLIGVADGVPKLMIRAMLAPAFELLHAGLETRLECREWRTDILLEELARHRLDLVISDVASIPGLSSRLLSYDAGTSGIMLLAAPMLAARARRRFPRGLESMPFLMPVRESPLRRAVDAWLDANHITPRVVAEVDDRALLNQLGQAGLGVFPAAAPLEKELCRQFQVERVAMLKGLRERYFVITTRRRLRHPGVAAICERARKQFTAAGSARDATPA